MREAAFKHAFGIPAFNKLKKELKAGSRAFIYQVDFFSVPCLMAVTFGGKQTSNLPELLRGEEPPEELPTSFYPEGSSKLIGEVDFGQSSGSYGDKTRGD